MDKQRYLISSELRKHNCIVAVEGVKVDKDHPIQVSIEPYKKSRSLAQNSLYWKWLTEIGKETGHSKDELHAVFATKLLEPVSVEWQGKVINTIRSTTSLSVGVFAQYLTELEAYVGSELGIRLEHPEDLWYEATNADPA